MTSRQILAWAWVHKWSSLVCTVFMLLLCLTGLPLIFHHEIGHLLGSGLYLWWVRRRVPLAQQVEPMAVTARSAA